MKYLHNYSSFRKKHTLNEKIVDAHGLVDPKVLEYWNGLYDKWVAKTLNPQEEKDYQSMTDAKVLLCYGKGSSENPLKKFDQKFLRLKWAKKIIEGFKEKFGKDISEATDDELNEWNYEFAYEVLGADENEKDIPMTIAYEDIDELKKYAKNPEKYFKDYSDQLNEFLDEIEIPWVEICDSLKVKEVESKPQSRNLFMRFVDWLGKKIKKGLGWIERKSVQLATFVCTGDFGAFNDYDPDMREDDRSELIKQKKAIKFRREKLKYVAEIFSKIGDDVVNKLKKSGAMKKLSDYKNKEKIVSDNKFILNDDIISIRDDGSFAINGKLIIEMPAYIKYNKIFEPVYRGRIAKLKIDLSLIDDSINDDPSYKTFLNLLSYGVKVVPDSWVGAIGVKDGEKKEYKTSKESGWYRKWEHIHLNDKGGLKNEYDIFTELNIEEGLAMVYPFLTEPILEKKGKVFPPKPETYTQKPHQVGVVQAQTERQPLVTKTWGFDDAKDGDTVDTVWYLRNKYKTLEKTPTESKWCWQVLSNEVDSWKKLNPGEKNVEKGIWNSLEEIPQFLRKESKKLSPEVIAQYTKLAKDAEAQKKSGGKGTIIKGLDDTGLLY